MGTPKKGKAPKQRDNVFTKGTRAREMEVIEKKGGCNGIAAKLAQTNGVPQTLRWIKNIGTCPVTLFCVDDDGDMIEETAEELPAGDSLVLYSSPEDAYAIMMNCAPNDSREATCQIEMAA